ncbi:MAG: ABC transporter substrate-binding protein [Hyphomicrobiales bacterium]|jgi:peptide/nickel transport system substrate-binding protein
MKRRTFLAAGASTLAAPLVGRAQDARVLRMVPQANVTSIDPIWTTAIVTRNHAYIVYDTLFGLDADLQPQPQMAAGYRIEQDGRKVTIALREGLRFHDGTPVRARDCVASIRRWAARNGFGQTLMAATDEIVHDGDANIVFRLKAPFPLLPNALASVSQPAFIMPERIAQTDPFKQITDATGSGPFRWKADEFNSGSLMVYERHAGYVPATGAPSLTAGGKIAHFDRVEWQIIADGATAAAALQNGEIDWYEQPPPELQQLLARNRNIVVEGLDRFTNPAILRMNHLQPPFDDVEVRRAVLPAIVQSDFMAAVAGDDPANYDDRCGIFTPGTPMATDAGMEVLTRPRSLETARAALRAAGYNGAKVRLIGPTDILAPSAITQVAADLLPRIGFNVDLALSDWGTVIQRRVSREPVDKGGWSVLLTTFSSFDNADPAALQPLRANGAGAWFGWPSIPKLEELRTAWFAAPDTHARKALCAEMQRVALDQVVYVPVGSYRSMTSYRRNLTGRVLGFPILWNIRKT